MFNLLYSKGDLPESLSLPLMMTHPLIDGRLGAPRAEAAAKCAELEDCGTYASRWRSLRAPQPESTDSVAGAAALDVCENNAACSNVALGVKFGRDS